MSLLEIGLYKKFVSEKYILATMLPLPFFMVGERKVFDDLKECIKNLILVSVT
jgi:hypothetical protein